MTLKEVSSVIDDINEWENPRGGSVYYVTAICTDEDVLSVGRKDYDAALEVQGLLREAIGVEQDFTLEPAKPTKTGRTKWKVLGFGTPGGAATYTAPGIQGSQADGKSPTDGRKSDYPRGRSPEHNDDIAKAVALKAAVQVGFVGGAADVLKIADEFYAWLRASEPALSAYPSSGTVTPVVEPQAGVGSEQSIAEILAANAADKRRVEAALRDGPQETRPLPADSGEGVGEATVAQALGEGTPAPSSHISEGFIVTSKDGDEFVPHEHDWQPHPQLRGKLKCDCGAMRNKVA